MMTGDQCRVKAREAFDQNLPNGVGAEAEARAFLQSSETMRN
jgi:hypothetical protein